MSKKNETLIINKEQYSDLIFPTTDKKLLKNIEDATKDFTPVLIAGPDYVGKSTLANRISEKFSVSETINVNGSANEIIPLLEKYKKINSLNTALVLENVHLLKKEFLTDFLDIAVKNKFKLIITAKEEIVGHKDLPINQSFDIASKDVKKISILHPSFRQDQEIGFLHCLTRHMREQNIDSIEIKKDDLTQISSSIVPTDSLKELSFSASIYLDNQSGEEVLEARTALNNLIEHLKSEDFSKNKDGINYYLQKYLLKRSIKRDCF